MADLTVIQNKYGYYISPFTITNADGTAFDLTGYTITMKMWSAGMPNVLKMTGVLAALVEASGTCRYLVASGDFPTSGKFLATIVLTKSGVEDAVLPFTLEVLESA